MINVRKLLIEDIDDVFNWRNDLVSRKNSINQKKIKYPSHRVWFKKILLSKENKYFIGTHKREKVGFVRYEKNKDDNYVVSININPEFRNRGFGSKLLLKSQLQKEIIKDCKVLFSMIKKNNLASIKTFEKANYTKCDELRSYYLFCNCKNRDKVKYMKKLNKQKKYQKIIDQIESIRSKNNGNWMNILRIAFKYSPDEAAKTMSKIYKEDQRISTLAKKLGK